MIMDDTLRYMNYYKNKKGEVDLPSVKIEETTNIIRPVRVVEVAAPPQVQTERVRVIRLPARKAKRARPQPKAKPKKKAKPIKKAKSLKMKDDFGDVEKELKKLEKDLTKENTKKGAKKLEKPKVVKAKLPSAKKKAAVKKAPKKNTAKSKTAADKKPEENKSEKNEGGPQVTIEANKGVDVKIKYNDN
jgi:hypothetical protein